MRGENIRRFFDRQTLSDLIVFWFAAWILWWFRRWMGHGPALFPDPGSAGARAYYSLEMRTLARSLVQSFVIACAALFAWRMLRRRAPRRKRTSS